MRLIKRPPTAQPITDDHPWSAIFAAAKREYNEQVGSIVAARDSWRLAAFGSMAIAGLAVWGYTTERNKNHIVPYVVEVNRLGDSIAAHKAEGAAPLSPKQIKYQLKRWVYDVRVVYTDPNAQKAALDEANNWTDGSSAAHQQLIDWMSKHNPYQRARDNIVIPHVIDAIPMTGNTWRISWTEEVRTRGGQLAENLNLETVITFAVSPPTDEDTISKNPNGLYVQSFAFPEG